MTGINQNLQTIAFLIALVELIVGLYVFILDYRSKAYRLISLILTVIAANTFALGYLAQPGSGAARLAIMVMAAASPLIVVLLLITSITLFRPILLETAWGRRAVYVAAIVGALPVILTILDAFTGSKFWITLPAEDYSGSLVGRSVFTGGIISPFINAVVYGALGIFLLGFLSFTIVAGAPHLRRGRASAVWLLVASILSAAPDLLSPMHRYFTLFQVASSAGCLVAFSLAAFEHNQHSQRSWGSLQTRLTLVALVIALPLLAAMGIILTDRARAALEDNASASLASVNQNIIDAAEIWLTSNSRALRMLTADEDIRSMDPAQQASVLRSLTAIYPNIHLAATADLYGENVARSDARPGVNYSDRVWFQETAAGLPISYQVVFDRTMGRPVLEMAMPIRDAADRVVGVAMFATRLTQIERLINQETSTAGASVLIVNNTNQLIAATENQAALMLNLDPTAPVRALRSGVHGSYRYTDNAGGRWIANINILSNGWGVIVQETEAELFAPVRSFQRLSLLILAIGAVILMWLTFSTIRQALQPVRNLTETAAAITAGDLTRSAPVYGQDELGVLAESFNAMTSQLRDLIGGLEQRIAERTQEVERRAVQLQTTADVAREAASIHDPDRLLADVVRLISDRFDFYHAGIFLLEDAGRSSDVAHPQTRVFAVLRAASSEGGQQMLKRGHRLAVGSTRTTGQGIVGYVAATGKPRIALDVGTDAVFFNNPDLPMTRSEMALPLKLGGRVIGVLDVQSRKPSAFTAEDEAILQTLADQLALAIENARLINESRLALNELESLYGRQVQRGWQKRLGNQNLIFRLEAGQIAPATAKPADQDDAGDAGGSKSAAPYTLDAPIELRGARLGTLNLRRRPEDGPWTPVDLELARETVAQMALALENARLLEEIQTRAAREEAINRITSRVARSLDLDGVLRSAALELSKLPAVREASVMIGAEASANLPSSKEDPECPTDPARLDESHTPVPTDPTILPEDHDRGGGNGHHA